MDDHTRATHSISTRISHFHSLRLPYRIYHGHTNSTRRSTKTLANTVDTSHLTHILSLDPTTKTITVEPNVPMDALVDATLKEGLIPMVVPEFPGITCGGAFSGTSGESSSWKYGAFESNVNWIEIVLTTGEVTRVGKTGEGSDLFWGAASAFGTLGVVTLLELRLRDAREFVELTYRRVVGFGSAVEVLRKETREGAENDFVDAITFDEDASIVMTGNIVDKVPQAEAPRIQTFSRAMDPWFYTHAQTIEQRLAKISQSDSQVYIEHIPLREYLFRWDRGGFWMARYAFTYFCVPFNALTRFIFDPFMHTRELYHATHKSGMMDYYMVQDVGIPYEHAQEFAAWLHDALNVYPLWLCPLKTSRDNSESAHGLHSEFGRCYGKEGELLNFGVWGRLPMDRRKVVEANRALERKVAELGGKKWLYAQTYYTEDEFWAHYDKKSYDVLRNKYQAGYLPSVYDKVKLDLDELEASNASWWSYVVLTLKNVWPIRGVFGASKALLGGDYLLSASKRSATGGKAQKID